MRSDSDRTRSVQMKRKIFFMDSCKQNIQRVLIFAWLAYVYADFSSMNGWPLYLSLFTMQNLYSFLLIIPDKTFKKFYEQWHCHKMSFQKTGQWFKCQDVSFHSMSQDICIASLSVARKTIKFTYLSSKEKIINFTPVTESCEITLLYPHWEDSQVILLESNMFL